MNLLLLLTWPYVRKHLLRSLLTIAGIALGVAVFTGMHTANETVGRAFQQTVNRIAGSAQLQVSAGETGFPEEVLERVQSVREVSAAAPVIEAALDTGMAGQGSLLVLGVDMTGDRSLRDYDLEGGEEEVIDDPLIFLAQPDSLIVSREFAGRNRLRLGQKITFKTMSGARRFTIRGIMKPGGLAQAFGGSLGIMDIYATQAVFGRGRMFDRIDIGVQEGVSIDECRKKLEALLGPGFQVEPPSSRGRHFESIARGLSVTINVSSLFALLIGIFIIYNSFAIAITQRRAEIGVLRALGASRWAVERLFLMESAAAGVAGSALGVALGLLMARGIAPGLSGIVQEVYGHAQRADEIAADPELLALAMLTGVAASVVGGLIPARLAARVDPVLALQKGRNQVMGAGSNRWRLRIAGVVSVAAGACLALGRSQMVYYAGYALAVLALVLSSPSLSMWLARALRPLLKWFRPVEGTLAADSLIQAPRRTSATVTALMLSLALAIGFSGVAGGIYKSVLAWMEAALNPDLYVSPTESVTAKTFRFPAEVGEKLRATPGVEEVQEVRNARVMVNGRPLMAVAVDIRQVARRIAVRPVEGEREEMVRETAAGRGVIISDSLTLMYGIHKGDTLEIPTPRGKLAMAVVGSTVDYSDQQGSFLMDRAVFVREWGDDTSNLFRVHVKKGYSADAVRRTILERLGATHQLFVFTNSAIREYILKTTEQWFGLTYVQLFVAVLVAMLGIVNTLTVSISDRRRELGILQAVGGMRGQIRATIWLEAVTIGIIGIALGALAGAVTLFYNLRMLRGDIGGLRLDFLYPFQFVAMLVPVIVGCAFLSALWPAEAAVRASLVESLEYE
jgi:putative ABC transport system permease protein